MAAINSENREAWQALAAAVSVDRPSVGKRVRVVDGRKHRGTEGRVTWHGLDKFSDAFRYASEAQAHLREMAGRRGFRVRIQPDQGEAFFVRADYVQVLPEEPAPVPIKTRLEDGRRYWLGATWATYHEAGDFFSDGNWYVHRADTPYRDGNEAEAETYLAAQVGSQGSR